MFEAKLLRLAMSACLAAVFSAGPAAAGVCGNLVSVEDGYCEVYCEALDCDGDPQGPVETCVTLFDAYKQEAGMAPPCEADLACPCVAAFSAFARLLDTPEMIDNYASVDGVSMAAGTVGVVADGGKLTCSAIYPSGSVETLRVTWEEAEACAAMIAKAAAVAKESRSWLEWPDLVSRD